MVTANGQDFELHHLIWFSAYYPKMALFLLRALLAKLLTRDRLLQFGKHTNK